VKDMSESKRQEGRNEEEIFRLHQKEGRKEGKKKKANSSSQSSHFHVTEFGQLNKCLI
jgi:hypothetical protein